MMLRRIPKSVLMTPSLESEEVTAQTTDNKETTTEVVTTPEVTETVVETPVSEKTTSETEHSEAPQATTVAVATSTVVEQTVETPVVTTSEEETVKPQETQTVTTPVEETVVVDSQPTETVSEVTDTTVQQTEEVTTSNEGVKGALIGGAAGAFGPIGGAVAGHYAEKEIDKLKEKIENLEKENKDLRSGKSSASQEDEQTATPTTDESVSQTDTATEVTEKIDAAVDSQTETDTQTTEQTEQQVAETPVETPPSSEEVAQVAVQAATDAVKEAGAAEGTTVVTVVIEPVVSAEENEELAVLSEQVQSDTEQATRVAVESEELAGEIDTLVESRDTLGKLNDVAANAVDNGGLSEDGAQALSVAVESIYTRIGLEGYNGIPSMEAFSSEFSKVNATSVAMEDIKEKMQAIGKSIVEGIKKMIEFLTEMFDKFLTANGRMLERAKKIAEAAKTYEAKVDTTISSPSVYKNLAVGESIPDKKTLINGLGQMSKFIEGLASITSNEEFRKYNKIFEKMMSNSLISTYKGIFKGEGDAAKDYEKFKEEHFTILRNLDFLKFVKATSLSEANADRAIKYGAFEKENTRLVASPIFPGNTIIYGHVYQNTVGDMDTFSNLISFGKVTKRELAGDNKNLQVLSEQEITQLCSLAIKFVESVKHIEQEIKNSRKALASISEVIIVTSSVDYAKSSSGNVVSKLIKYFTTVINICRHISFGLFGSASAEGTRVFNAALDYCQLSLNAGTKTSETKKIA